MADSPRVLINLIVVAAFECLVTKKVDCRVIHSARQVLVVLDVLQAVRLVPARWEDIEGNLTTNGVAINGVSGMVSFLDAVPLTSG